jgi:hypothetical protein
MQQLWTKEGQRLFGGQGERQGRLRESKQINGVMSIF